MMKWFKHIAFVFLLLFTSATQPYAQDVEEDKVLSIDLANNRVEVTSGFNGDYLIVFGVQDQPGDLAITISGPEKTTTVRRKENVFGVWMNRHYMRFKNVPSYYSVATTKAPKDIADKKTLQDLYIGVETLVFPSTGKANDKDLKDFQQAMIRNKRVQKLYPHDVLPITKIDKNFFRAQFYVPANAPIGDYTVNTYLFQNGKLQAQDKKIVKVLQVGTSAAIFDYAKDWSFAYGILCVLFALSAGWLSSTIRQRFR